MSAVEAPIRHSRLDGFASTTLVGLCLIWGLNQVAVKVVNGGLQPVFQAGLRSLIGAVLVILWCRFRGVALFRRDGTLPAGVLAGALFGVEFILVYIGLDLTSVSRAIIFLYFMPFVVAVGAHFLIPGERLTWVRSAGLLAAFVGVVVAFSDRLSLPSPSAVFGDALCLIAAFAWGATTLTIRTTRLNTAPSQKVLFYQLAVSAVMMLVLAPFFGPLVRDITVWVGIGFAYQVLVVVAASYLAWFYLIAHYPAAQLSAFVFLTPVFAVIFGGALLGEPLTARLLIALVLVGAGIYLVNRPGPA